MNKSKDKLGKQDGILMFDDLLVIKENLEQAKAVAKELEDVGFAYMQDDIQAGRLKDVMVDLLVKIYNAEDELKEARKIARALSKRKE